MKNRFFNVFSRDFELGTSHHTQLKMKFKDFKYFSSVAIFKFPKNESTQFMYVKILK